MNCKPGDLAIIMKAILSENIGRIVLVLRSSDIHPKLGFRWFVKPQNPMRIVSGADLVTIAPVSTDIGAMPDAWLKPVSGLPMDDEVTNEASA